MKVKVILATHGMQVPPREISRTEMVMTMVGGTRVFRSQGGRLQQQ